MVDSEAVMTKITNIFGYTKDTSASKDMGVWNLDTADMTLAELEEYKKELQRLDERDRSRRNRNIRLVVYALILIALLTGLALLPGTIRAQNGPVVLTPMGDYSFEGEQKEGPGGNQGSHVKRLSDHSFQMCFKEEINPYSEDYEYYFEDYIEIDITGNICQEPERLNRQGKSSVSYSDGTTGAVWYERRTGSRAAYLMVEYKGNIYGYYWGSLSKYDSYKKK